MKQTKHPTIRFYTNTGKYMGWKYLHKTTYGEIRSWTNSGNKFKLQ